MAISVLVGILACAAVVASSIWLIACGWRDMLHQRRRVYKDRDEYGGSVDGSFVLGVLVYVVGVIVLIAACFWSEP